MLVWSAHECPASGKFSPEKRPPLCLLLQYTVHTLLRPIVDLYPPCLSLPSKLYIVSLDCQNSYLTQCVANIRIFEYIRIFSHEYIHIRPKFELRIYSDIHSSIPRWTNIFEYSFGEEHYICCTKVQG